MRRAPHLEIEQRFLEEEYLSPIFPNPKGEVKVANLIRQDFKEYANEPTGTAAIQRHVDVMAQDLERGDVIDTPGYLGDLKKYIKPAKTSGHKLTYSEERPAVLFKREGSGWTTTVRWPR